MTKPVIRRRQARQDVEAAIDHYGREGGERLALNFIEQVQAAFRAIGERPAIGSPRWGEDLNLSGVRTWRVKRFPWLVFYVERDSNIEVWRVLHSHADIPTRLPPSGEEPAPE